jgi:hypothetical protein
MRIGRLDRDRARKALISVRTVVAKNEARFRFLRRVHDAPDRLVEPYPSAVKAVAAIVRGEPMLAAVEHERCAGNSIREAPNQRTEVTFLGEIISERGQREDNIIANASAVRHFERDDRPAIGDNLRAQSRLASQRVDIDRRAVRRHPV